jgi:hypothetical protein
MDSLKGLSKGGWHPKGKGGGKETWRGDFKGIDTVVSNNSNPFSFHYPTYIVIGKKLSWDYFVSFF